MPEETGQGSIDTTIAGLTGQIGASSSNVAPTPTGQPNELQLLKAQLAEANTQIDRLKGTQAANDRALAAKKVETETMAAKIAELTAAVQARDGSITATDTELTALRTQVAELLPLKEQAERANREARRMALAAKLAASNPVVSALVDAGALPAAETDEEFVAALQKISAATGKLVTGQTNSILAGALKPPVPAADANLSSLEDEAQRLIRIGNTDEGLKLYKQAMELRFKKE